MKKIILVFTVMFTVFNHMTLMAQEKIKQIPVRNVCEPYVYNNRKGTNTFTA